MKTLVSLMLCIAFMHCANAALPICQFDDPTGNGEWQLHPYKEPSTLAIPDGGCVVWYCDTGHKWVAEGFCGTAADAAQYSTDTMRSWIGMTTAERNQLWANNVQPAAPGSIYARMIAFRDALPKPATPPPSGLVTTSTTVYAVSASKNYNVLSPVGTVALGVTCDITQSVSNSTGRFFVIPVASVTWTGSPRLRVYAKCDS